MNISKHNFSGQFRTVTSLRNGNSTEKSLLEHREINLPADKKVLSKSVIIVIISHNAYLISWKLRLRNFSKSKINQAKTFLTLLVNWNCCTSLSRKQWSSTADLSSIYLALLAKHVVWSIPGKRKWLNFRGILTSFIIP